jgi:hypothetical protein
MTVDRRTLLVTGAAAATAAALGPPLLLATAATPGAAAAVAGERAFFSMREFAILDEIAEMIIPADERSGGARAAGVAGFLEQRIGESRDPEWRQSWRDDLAEIDRLSRAMHGKGFLEASVAERERLLERLSRNEASPKEAGEYAFGTIKWSVADAYYRTRIGIHDELGYKGNVVQDEFSGGEVGSR